MSWHGVLLTCIITALLTPTAHCQGLSKWQCFGQYFGDEFCTSPQVISVTRATYSYSGQCAGACCPQPDDCQVPVGEENGDYIQSIRNKCDNRQRCVNLQALRVFSQDPCPSNMATDYVTIYYQCLGETPSMSTSTKSTDIPATPASTDATNTTGGANRPPSSGLSPGAIAAIVICVLLSIIIIFCIGISIMIRRKNPNWPQSHNWKEPFKDFKSYMPDSLVYRLNKPKEPVVEESGTPRLRYHSTTVRHSQTGLPASALSAEGVQIVRTPQDAIDISSGSVPATDAGDTGEPLYETIDDVTRDMSLRRRRSASSDSFDSVTLASEPTGESSAPEMQLADGGNSKMTINDVIYYGAVTSRHPPVPSMVSNAAYERSSENYDQQNGYTRPSEHRMKPSEAKPTDTRKGRSEPQDSRLSNSRVSNPEVAAAEAAAALPTDQVYENTEFVDDDGETYYNADIRYSRLNPAARLKPAPGEAYQDLHRQTSSSC